MAVSLIKILQEQKRFQMESEIPTEEELLAELDALQAEFEKSMPIKEGIFDSTISDLQKKFEAARRGIGLMNKIERGSEKGKHASRIMSMMNTIRATITFLRKNAAKFGG